MQGQYVGYVDSARCQRGMGGGERGEPPHERGPTNQPYALRGRRLDGVVVLELLFWQGRGSGRASKGRRALLDERAGGCWVAAALGCMSATTSLSERSVYAGTVIESAWRGPHAEAKIQIGRAGEERGGGGGVNPVVARQLPVAQGSRHHVQVSNFVLVSLLAERAGALCQHCDSYMGREAVPLSTHPRPAAGATAAAAGAGAGAGVGAGASQRCRAQRCTAPWRRPAQATPMGKARAPRLKFKHALRHLHQLPQPSRRKACDAYSSGGGGGTGTPQ